MSETYNETYNRLLYLAKKVVIRHPTKYEICMGTPHNGIESFYFKDKLDDSVKSFYSDYVINDTFIANYPDEHFGERAKRMAHTEMVSYFFNFDTILNKNNKWHKRFLNLSTIVSTYSKDPSTKVGAVIVDDDDNVRTIGYNEFPRGVKYTEARLNDRSQKYPLVVHAELNAICTCARVGVPTKGSTMVCTHFPCADCAGAIVQAGFKEVVVLASTTDFDSRWSEANKFATLIFTEGNVDVTVYTEEDLSNTNE